MIRSAVLSLVLCATPALSQGLGLSAEDRAAFGRELRAALLADPEPILRALDGPGLYSEAVEQDRANLADQADLFAATPRGYGADTPRLTVVFFEDYPCADCADAWAAIDALLARHPDIRVEPRFASASGAAQLLLSVLDHQGHAAYHDVRMRLMEAATDETLSQVIASGGWVQDRMYRAAPTEEANAFRALDLQSAPSFVLPNMMIQGAVPLIVLEKYVAD